MFRHRTQACIALPRGRIKVVWDQNRLRPMLRSAPLLLLKPAYLLLICTLLLPQKHSSAPKTRFRVSFIHPGLPKRLAKLMSSVTRTQPQRGAKHLCSMPHDTCHCVPAASRAYTKCLLIAILLIRSPHLASPPLLAAYSNHALAQPGQALAPSPSPS